MVQTIAELIGESALEDALLPHVSGPARGELDDFDLRPAEPPGRCRREEEERRVPRRLVVADPRHEAHPAIDVPLVGLVESAASDVAQVLADLRLA